MSTHPFAAFIEGIPANQLLGLKVEEMGDGVGVVRLPWRDEIANHVGSVHAAALFAIADATSGAAMTGALGDLVASVTPLARGGEITYKKVARGDILGRAEISAQELARLRDELEREGVVRPDVVVTMTDADGTVVATAVFHWHVKKNA